ncbi:hypothetical protein EC912_101658 [Luteibacter rhizovicinus]|uniref:Uncharacterized protein n=1 Tax=Luteibacter rhizovicinus TaxID=242606 RepID=A0A4R3YY08_9GAMM|nr:hypothetical protein [Luteibacter rhizovicinus]TCV97641.1 hypothetical protein EC912_101658 [Luteibacter rhizovicinus]
MRTMLIKSLAVALLIYFVVSDLLTTTPDVKQNPNPKMRYEITLTVNDAPGSFDAVTGLADYEVKDLSCVPVTGAPLNAMRMPPETKRIAINFRRIANDVYRGDVYLDGVIDEDYFGLGVCHWSLDTVITFVRTNNLTLSPRIPREEFSIKKGRLTYFDRENYKRNQVEETEYGWLHHSQIAPNRQDHLFSITLSAKEAF